MTVKAPGQMTSDELRREMRRLQARAGRAGKKPGRPNREQLIRELRINQLELEMQNRELREARKLVRDAAARDSELYDAVPIGFCRLELDGRIQEINQTASALLGVPRQQLVGRMFAAAAELKEKAPFLAHMRRCAMGKGRVTTELVLPERAGRGSRQVRLVSDPISDSSAEGLACRSAIIDITDLKTMEARIRLLADAGALLAASLSSPAVLEVAQRILVPALADLCLIDLASEAGSIDRAAIKFANHENQSSFRERMRQSTPQAGWLSPQAQVITSGEPMLLSEMPAMLRVQGEPERDDNVFRSVGVRSLMIVPLPAHGRIIGAITLASAESGRLYARADLRLAQEFAGRLAVALENARLYDETQRMNRLLLGGAKASAIVAISPDAIVSVDENYRITLWNDGAQRMYGYSPEEAMGAPLDMLIPERYRTAHRAFVEHFAAGRELARKVGGPTRETVGLRKNGEEFPADTTISKLELDGRKVLTVAVRDVTDQKRIESEQRTLARLGQVVASSLDLDDTLTRVVRLAAEVFGDYAILYLTEDDHRPHRVRAASREATTAWYCETMLRLREDARPEHPISRVIATKQPLLLDVTPAVLASLAHNEKHARSLTSLQLRSVMAVPLTNGETCLGALLFKSSSHRYTSQDLRVAQEIGYRTALLIENAKLHKTEKEAISARDNILRVVAHDLRNPLSAIFLEVSALKMLEEDPEGTVHAAARLIEDSAQFMNRLIRDLLDVARIESGRLSVDRSSVPVAVAISRFVRRHEVIAESKSLELRVEVLPDVGCVFADAERLLQVLENLVSNAERFTPEGGRITIGAIRQATQVQFWVADTGAGMDSSALAHVFERFSAKRRVERGGTGLGLPIVKGIVEAHGGRVWAESKVGEGSRFFFTMPIAHADAPRRNASARVRSSPGKAKIEGNGSAGGADRSLRSEQRSS